jgi:hypothetical protein
VALLGAYGLRLEGLPEAASMLVPADDSWPSFQIATRVADDELEVQTVGPDRAAIAPASGTVVRIERDPGRVTFTAPVALSAEAIVHPLLAHVAAITAWWFGRESLHAGAFVAGGGVWALVGDRGAGKSSTLAWLAREGHEVVCDDMLVLEADQPFAGPRSLDLRESAAALLGEGEPLGVIGERERWRMPVAPSGQLPPLRGLIHLTWGEELRAHSPSVHRRLELITANRGVKLPATAPEAWLDLASLAWFELERPQRWEELPRVADELRRLAG